MAATRRQPALQIFQDPVDSTDHHEVATFEPQVLDAFGPVTDVSNHHHTLLQPPATFSHAPSPQKARHPSSSPPPRALAEKGLNRVSLPPPQEQLFRTDAPVKRTQRPIPKQSQMMAGKSAPLFTNFTSQISQFDKENVATDSFAHISRPISAEPFKPGSKRSLSDAAPLRDRSKKPKVREVRVVEDDGPLPEPHEMPAVEDDGEAGVKPPYSYANLIGMAILRAPNRRLTLAQIYKWISDTFSFYRNPQDTGWQNSIRHNLSLSKSFSKQERPKDDPGKGHYWRINAGFEKQYYKIKSTRRLTNPDGFVPANPSDLVRPASSSASFPPPMSVVKSIDSSKFPEETELSSDATIPCSDPACHDGVDSTRMNPPARPIPSSPPAAEIKSSPPPVARSARENTPPRVPRFPTHSSRSGGRKRKFGFGDSGYYSSIESSAIKGNPLGTLLTSEGDLGNYNIKRGRAEEEIARIRGSSYDSPSKTRPSMRQPGAGPLASSPFRSAEKQEGPLTPAIVFKRPALPPPSASPNTNLRNHRNRMRELVGGSPDKSMPMLGNVSFLDTNWSPAVPTPQTGNANLVDGFPNTFDIFGDFDYQESPLKPSAKRPRLERAATTTGVLADITSFNPTNIASPTPYLRSPFLEMPSFIPSQQGSPMKAPTSNPLPAIPELSTPAFTPADTSLAPKPTFAMAAPAAAPVDDDIFHLIYSDESEEGIDLLQGFAKIGAKASVAPNGSPTKPSRPGLGRSSTSMF